jgi:hypothetical protein
MVRNYLAEAEKKSKELLAAATHVKSAPRKVGWLDLDFRRLHPDTSFNNRIWTTPSKLQLLHTSADRQRVSRLSNGQLDLLLTSARNQASAKDPKERKSPALWTNRAKEWD